MSVNEDKGVPRKKFRGIVYCRLIIILVSEQNKGVIKHLRKSVVGTKQVYWTLSVIKFCKILSSISFLFLRTPYLSRNVTKSTGLNVRQN